MILINILTMKNNIFLLICFLSGILLSCGPQTTEESTEGAATSVEASSLDSSENEPLSQSEQIIAQSLEAHGGEKYKRSKVSFDFRDRHYIRTRKGGEFVYERIFKDSTGQEIKDVLNNEGFSRTIERQADTLSQEQKDRYANSVNSVMYFMFLPYKLQDPAVQTEYLGETQIKAQPYHKIKVSFRQEDGGEDYSDLYVYWIHKEKNTLDYLAYSYEVNEGGSRFREAINPRRVEGILFQDYINYGGEKDTDIRTIDRLFEEGKLEKVSEIINENIEVTLLDSLDAS